MKQTMTPQRLQHNHIMCSTVSLLNIDLRKNKAILVSWVLMIQGKPLVGQLGVSDTGKASRWPAGC